MHNDQKHDKYVISSAVYLLEWARSSKSISISMPRLLHLLPLRLGHVAYPSRLNYRRVAGVMRHYFRHFPL